MLAVLPGRLILTGGLIDMNGIVQTGVRSVMDVALECLRNCRMAITAGRLHRNRSSQSAAAEQRQPNGQNYCNELSDRSEHGRSLAKFGPVVKPK